MNELFAVLSFLIIVAPILPYYRDMRRGRVRPSRSTRVMFFVLLSLALLQQRSLGSGLGLALLVGELIGSLFVLVSSIKYGVGGMSKLDLSCYGLLFIDLAVWAVTKNALLAIFLTMIADSIACVPTVVKTWRDQKSETYLWWLFGVIAPIFSVLSEGVYDLKTILFPLYLMIANLIIVLLIVVPRPKQTINQV